jgi:glycosyltransferase involved in cell wall biosynthesis
MAEATHQRGHQVTVLTTDTLDQHGARVTSLEEMINGVRVVRLKNLLPALRGRYNLSTPAKLRQTARTLLQGVDVLHLHEFRTVENIIVTKLAAEMNLPMVLSPHGTLAQHTGRSALKTRWDSWFSPYIAQRIHTVIALTEQEKRDTEALWSAFWKRKDPLNIPIIPNGVTLADFGNLPDPPPFRQQWNLGDARVVLFMGRLHPRKGAEILAKAFVQANIPNTQLLIVGPDEGSEMAIRALNDSRIVLTGYLGGEQRLAALAASDLFVLPAVGEGLPMAALEAMACGLPVILSPECNLPEVDTYQAGKTVAVSVAVLTEALQLLLANPSMMQAMGANARALVADKFTWERVAAGLEGVYSQVITPKEGTHE